MDVSIVVPIYNVEKYLLRCLESLNNQDFNGSYEVLLINDGSTDDSGSVAESWAFHNSQIFSYFEKENGGLSDARNYGIERAHGEYVAFVDSDDYVEPSFISKLYGKALETGSDIVICSYIIEREDGSSRSIRQKGWHSYFGKSVSDEPRLMRINAPYAWNKLYRRSLFLDNNLFYPKGLAYEDIATTYPLLLASNQIDKVEEPLIHYISSRSGSITGTFNERKLNVLPALKLMIHRSRHVIDSKLSNYKEELDNEVFAIAARHIFYRLRELRKYRGVRRRLSFVRDSFRLLDEEFPEWETDEEKIALLSSERIKIENRSRWTTEVIKKSLVPLSVQKMCRKSVSRFKKIIHLFTIKRHRRYFYAFMRRHLAIKNNVALIESFHGNEISDSPRVLALELSKKDGWSVYYSYRGQKPAAIEGSNIKFVKIYTIRYLYLLATSKVLINSVSFPPYFIRRDEQLYINTWHGTPLKTLGKSMIHGVEDMNNIQRNFLQSTHLFFPDLFTEEHMMKDYSLTNLYCGKLVECVYPRNEPFVFSDRRRCFNSTTPFSSSKFAYMPTWRGATSGKLARSFLNEVAAFLDLAEQTLNEHQTLYVKLHSLMKGSIDLSGYSKVLPFPENIAPYDFLASCDALVTDYSSVMFDFALSGKPVLLLVPDRYTYEAERGTYISIDDLPFQKYDDDKKLLLDLKSEKWNVGSGELKELLGSFDYISPDVILNDIINNRERNYIKSYRPIKPVKSAVICNGCRTPSDIDALKSFVEGYRNIDGSGGVVLLLRAVDFTDALREEIRRNDKGLFDNFVITKGKEVRTHFEKLREMFLAKTDRRSLSALRRLYRYFPCTHFSNVVLLDTGFFNGASVPPVVLSGKEVTKCL